VSGFIEVEIGARRVHLAAQPVSFTEFHAFLEDSGRPMHAGLRRASASAATVIGASQLEAATYCEWMTGRGGRAYRLPSMEELDAVMGQGPAHSVDAGVWPHEQGHLTELIGGLKPVWLCEWTRETEERPGVGGRPGRVLASIFYPPWLREGNNVGHMHASLLASEGYSFVTFRLSFEG
jgi:formylglycine-generating enzyme required for sulfatase activity